MLCLVYLPGIIMNSGRSEETAESSAKIPVWRPAAPVGQSKTNTTKQSVRFVHGFSLCATLIVHQLSTYRPPPLRCPRGDTLESPDHCCLVLVCKVLCHVDLNTFALPSIPVHRHSAHCRPTRPQWVCHIVLQNLW